MRTSTFHVPLLALVAIAANASAQTIDAFDPLPEGAPKGLAIQPDGKILIGGSFLNVAGTTRRGVARLDADGSVDTSFGDPAANGEVTAIAVQTDGKLLVGGGFESVGGQPRHYLARLNSDGTLDTSFADPNLDSNVWAIAVQPDGKVLAAGDFTHIGATAQNYFARFSSAGAFDSSFANPQLCCVAARAVALQADGHVLVGGYFSQAGGVSHSFLARYSSSGVFDAAFPASPPPGPLGQGITVGPDGSIYVVGGYSTSDNTNTRLVSRLTSAGALVGSYDDLHNDGAANTFVLQPNGKLLIGGTFQQVDDQPRHALARLNADGTLDATFGDLAFSFDATHPNGSIFGIAAQADGKVLAVGNFTLVGAQPRQYAARVVTGDAVVSRFSGQASGTSVIATWTRSGGGPELAQPPTLMHSTDGVNFTAAGPMTRVANGWQATAPFNVHGTPFYLRATGTTSSGAQNGSTGRVASDIWFSDTIFADGFE
jgi:uncharacterized delta-60 repeat protein